jgi:hypothetical protein
MKNYHSRSKEDLVKELNDLTAQLFAPRSADDTYELLNEIGEIVDELITRYE